MRDDFLKQTITEIAKGVGYRCSNPDCARPKDEDELWITLYFGTKRKCDQNNFHKLSLDALTVVV